MPTGMIFSHEKNLYNRPLSVSGYLPPSLFPDGPLHLQHEVFKVFFTLYCFIPLAERPSQSDDGEKEDVRGLAQRRGKGEE